MIDDDGIQRYKPINWDYPNFKFEHREAGVSYFHDYHYEVHKGFTFVEYQSMKRDQIGKDNPETYNQHIYVSNTDLSRLWDLFNHWNNDEWHYKAIKVHDDTPARDVVISKTKWNYRNLPKDGSWFLGLKDFGFIPALWYWEQSNQRWTCQSGKRVVESEGPNYWLPIPSFEVTPAIVVSQT